MYAWKYLENHLNLRFTRRTKADILDSSFLTRSRISIRIRGYVRPSIPLLRFFFEQLSLSGNNLDITEKNRDMDHKHSRDFSTFKQLLKKPANELQHAKKPAHKLQPPRNHPQLSLSRPTITHTSTHPVSMFTTRPAPTIACHLSF